MYVLYATTTFKWDKKLIAKNKYRKVMHDKSMLIIIGTMTTSADVQAKLSEIWHSDHM